MTAIGPATGRWTEGRPPPNVRLGAGTVVTGAGAFKRFHAVQEDALVVGADGTMDGVQFALGAGARMTIGDHCYFSNAVLLAEQELRIGSSVVIGWNATIADTDFHPLDPALRITDAVACSPLAAGRPRPEVPCRPVAIGDDVWIGPNATILKGVTVGAGAFVEPGSLVTADVPPRARVLGNPATVVGTL